MIGIVISDKSLIAGVWSDDENGGLTLHNVKQIDYNDPIDDLIFSEGDLNSILGIALRRTSELIPFSGQDIAVAISDDFVFHDSVETEIDLAREDYWDYIKWIETNKNRPENQKMSIFGQIYLPDEVNIHTVAVSSTLIRTVKLSISELGGNPFWMGPFSSVVMDAGHVSDAAVVHKNKNQYKFLMVKNCRFDHGTIAFSSGQPKLISSTEEEEYTLGSFKLIPSDIDDVPVYSPDKLGRQALTCWEKSDLRVMTPFDDMKLTSTISGTTEHYESNVLTSLAIGASSRHSFNFFEEEKIYDFLFTEIFSEEKDIEKETFSVPQVEIAPQKKKRKSEPISGGEMVWLLFALIVIMGLFFAMNYVKFRESINKPLFGENEEYVIKKIDPINLKERSQGMVDYDINMHLQSREISKVVSKLFQSTELKLYNNLTITGTFISLEYMSGLNPDIEHIVGLETTSYSMESAGSDSTMFLWYYSFDFPELSKSDDITIGIDKTDFLAQLDSTINDYTIREFDQFYKTNRIYEPVLIWVRGDEEIRKATEILVESGPTVLLRKFVLFNEVDKPDPRAGFYVSFLSN
ncbi:MAG: hypothetical protein P8O00_01700 [Candidatus Marinimicrobia bacterium]|nr:hypothetical protein [Candidatus Neomarinimicrobiota bacterium]